MAKRTIITSPEGKEITFEDGTMCRAESPEKCVKISPKTKELMVDHAWHSGWKVETE